MGIAPSHSLTSTARPILNAIAPGWSPRSDTANTTVSPSAAVDDIFIWLEASRSFPWWLYSRGIVSLVVFSGRIVLDISILGLLSRWVYSQGEWFLISLFSGYCLDGGILRKNGSWWLYSRGIVSMGVFSGRMVFDGSLLGVLSRWLYSQGRRVFIVLILGNIVPDNSSLARLDEWLKVFFHKVWSNKNTARDRTTLKENVTRWKSQLWVKTEEQTPLGQYPEVAMVVSYVAFRFVLVW